MSTWFDSLRYDPIEPLLQSGDLALVWNVRRDLLGEEPGPAAALADLPAVAALVRRQAGDGSFPYPGTKRHLFPPWHYPLLETWKQFRYLVSCYGMTRSEGVCEGAAEYLWSRQTGAGDFRGFIGNQYAPYYTGAILGLLIRAGYGDDPRTEKGMAWLLDMRQDDGGWTVPIQTHKPGREELHRLTATDVEPLEPVRHLPFAHNCTGMVLRAFGEHPRRRRSAAARAAGELYASRMFRPDAYTSYKAADHWVRFQYPYWWNNLAAGLETLRQLDLPSDDGRVVTALAWLVEHQQPDGLWLGSYRKNARPAGPKGDGERRWISLAISRVLSAWPLSGG